MGRVHRHPGWANKTYIEAEGNSLGLFETFRLPSRTRCADFSCPPKLRSDSLPFESSRNSRMVHVCEHTSRSPRLDKVVRWRDSFLHSSSNRVNQQLFCAEHRQE